MNTEVQWNLVETIPLSMFFGKVCFCLPVQHPKGVMYFCTLDNIFRWYGVVSSSCKHCINKILLYLVSWIIEMIDASKQLSWVHITCRMAHKTVLRLKNLWQYKNVTERNDAKFCRITVSVQSIYRRVTSQTTRLFRCYWLRRYTLALGEIFARNTWI